MRIKIENERFLPNNLVPLYVRHTDIHVPDHLGDPGVVPLQSLYAVRALLGRQLPIGTRRSNGSKYCSSIDDIV